MNYYTEAIKEISTYIVKKDLKKASQLLEQELSMPFIPEIYEQKFLELQNQIKFLEIKKTRVTNSNLNKTTILKILQTENHYLHFQALTQIADLNLATCIDELKIIFKNINIKNSIKVVLISHLKAQKINQWFLIKTKCDWSKINPLFLDDNQHLTKTEQLIIDLTIQEPVLQQVAIEYLNQFVLNLFPIAYHFEKEDVETLIYLAKKALNFKIKEKNNKKIRYMKDILKRNL